MFKKTLVAAALSAMAASASAGFINVGGVSWDPDAAIDFYGASVSMRQVIAADGTLTGYGVVSTINGLSNFCAGCELTLQFGGYTPIAVGALPTTPGQVIAYSGGWVKVFVDASPDVTTLNPYDLTAANTGDGALWLDMVGVAGTSLIGTVNGGFGQISSLSGLGLLDVVGGLAKSNFDTNSQTNGADWSFSTSFTLLTNGVNDAGGTGNFYSNSIPEPASLGLLGLGLAGLALRRRRAA